MERIEKPQTSVDASPPEEPKLNIPWRPILCIVVPMAALAYIVMAVVAYRMWMVTPGM